MSRGLTQESCSHKSLRGNCHSHLADRETEAQITEKKNMCDIKDQHAKWVSWRQLDMRIYRLASRSEATGDLG